MKRAPFLNITATAFAPAHPPRPRHGYARQPKLLNFVFSRNLLFGVRRFAALWIKPNRAELSKSKAGQSPALHISCMGHVGAINPPGRRLTGAFSTGKKTLMRRARVLCVAVGMLAHSAAYGESADERFAQAAAAYDEQRYEESITQFETLLAEGLRAPELFYNLANAYYRAGMPAQAILHYRHAQYLAPRDADIRHNLVFVAQQTGALLPQPAIVIRRLGSLSLSEWAAMATVGWWLTALYLCLALWPTTQRGRRISISFSVLLLVVSLAGAHHWISLQGRPEIVVTEHGVEALFAPIDGYTAHFALPPGSIVRIESAVEGWYRVRADEKEGWIRQSAVEPVAPWRATRI